MVGDTTEDSVIWVPGESTGVDSSGASTVVPSGGAAANSNAYADAAVDALHDRLVASGVLPN